MAAGAVMDDDDQPAPSPGQGGDNSAGEDGAAGASAAPSSISGTAPPQASSGQAIPQSGGGQIPTPQSAGVNPEYDHDKLMKAQTPLDILNAMKPASRKEYMDWYEKTHGDIEEHYDNLMKQMGAPPEDQGLSKKEKFGALLQFGLTLMQRSSKPSPNQGAATISSLADTINSTQQSHEQAVQGAQNEYDQRQNAIINARNAELKQLGTAGQAMTAAGKLESEDAGSQGKEIENATKLYGAMHPGATGAFQIGQDEKGNTVAISRGADGQVVATPIRGIDGKPFQGRVLGKTTGSGVPTKDTAQQRNYRFYTSLGMDPESALNLASRKPQGNASKDHAAVYRATLNATAGDQEASQKAADQYVLENYGAQGLSNMNAPSLAPPAGALAGLKPGMTRTFANHTTWAMGIDGKPYMVQGPNGGGPPPTGAPGPNTIQ